MTSIRRTEAAPGVAPDPHASRAALDLLTRAGLDRLEFMNAICDAVPGSRTAALLWLYDVEWNLLVLDRYVSRATSEKVPFHLARLFVRKSTDWRDAVSQCSRVQRWAHRNGFSAGQAVVPVSAQDMIGHVQVLSDVSISTAAIDGLTPLCTALAAFLSSGRTGRRLAALDQIQKEGEGATSVRNWLTTAAEVALRNTSGTACLAFREMPGGGFRADAIATMHEGRVITLPPDPIDLEAKGVSVIRRVAELGKPRRVPRFYVRAMRERAFGSAKHDKALGTRVENNILNGDKIRSVLIAPVMFEKHAVAVFVLLNKRTESHLSAIFSATDAVMLDSICKYLSGLLPSTMMNEAARAIGVLVSPRTLKMEDDRKNLFAVIEKAIPGVIGAALIREQRPPTAPKLLLLGGSMSTSDPSLMISKRDQHVRISGTERFQFATQIESEALDSASYLLVECTRDFLTDFERGLLDFFMKGLLHPLLLEQNLESLLELRHALRGCLSGVVGYVEEAMQCYNLYERSAFAPKVLSVARFRKALERACFAANKTNQLLEAARVTLNQISRESLRLTTESLSGVLKRVINILRPFAIERRVELEFHNDMRDAWDRVTIDRLLIEMMICNLVDNAIKYSSPKTTVLIKLSPDRDQSVVQVTDYGLPIHPQNQVAIFQPFLRRLTGLRDARSGTGLGLPVAKQVVEAHGGVIDVRSVPAYGDVSKTTFSVRIPRVLPRESKL